LPGLILPGRPATGAPSQAEFVQVPADYVKEASIARLAGEGQRLMQKYRPALNAIEARFGVPAIVVLAIWGRETDYGRLLARAVGSRRQYPIGARWKGASFQASDCERFRSI
jgi:membrane-bound lytic murein transglycosylase B